MKIKFNHDQIASISAIAVIAIIGILVTFVNQFTIVNQFTNVNYSIFNICEFLVYRFLVGNIIDSTKNSSIVINPANTPSQYFCIERPVNLFFILFILYYYYPIIVVFRLYDIRLLTKEIVIGQCHSNLPSECRQIVSSSIATILVEAIHIIESIFILSINSIVVVCTYIALLISEGYYCILTDQGFSDYESFSCQFI